MENLRNKTHKEEVRQKEENEDFRLQNDEFDPYAIVVLNQLWQWTRVRSSGMKIEIKTEKKTKPKWK